MPNIGSEIRSLIEFTAPVRLIHVTTVPLSFGFFHGQIGYLKGRGFEVHMVSSPGELANHFRESEGVQVHSVPMARSITPFGDLVALWRLWKLFREVRPDIVHSHTPKAGLLGTIAARMAGVPVVFLSIFGLPQMTMKGLPRKLLNFSTRMACFLTHRVWCDSFSMRDYMIEKNLCPTEKVVVFGHGSVNGVDAQHTFSPHTQGPDVRAAVRRQYKIPKEATVLGYVGRIVGDKGMHELAGAWKVLRNQYADLHLFMVGPFEPKDPLLPEDEMLFRTDPRIHLAGQRKDVAPHFSAMDIFVMPSYREGFGITNIEAAAMELPVVSTRIPGCIDSVQDGLTGTLVPPRDSNALVEVIQMYINEPELRHNHGKAGRERVLRDFQQETIWEALSRDYMQLLKQLST